MIRKELFLTGDVGDVDKKYYGEVRRAAIEEYGVVEYYLECKERDREKAEMQPSPLIEVFSEENHWKNTRQDMSK